MNMPYDESKQICVVHQLAMGMSSEAAIRK